MGTVPWNDITHVGIFSKIKTQPPNVDNIATIVSPELIQLILLMLQGNGHIQSQSDARLEIFIFKNIRLAKGIREILTQLKQ